MFVRLPCHQGFQLTYQGADESKPVGRWYAMAVIGPSRRPWSGGYWITANAGSQLPKSLGV